MTRWIGLTLFMVLPTLGFAQEASEDARDAGSIGSNAQEVTDPEMNARLDRDNARALAKLRRLKRQAEARANAQDSKRPTPPTRLRSATVQAVASQIQPRSESSSSDVQRLAGSQTIDQMPESTETPQSYTPTGTPLPRIEAARARSPEATRPVRVQSALIKSVPRSAAAPQQSPRVDQAAPMSRRQDAPMRQDASLQSLRGASLPESDSPAAASKAVESARAAEAPSRGDTRAAADEPTPARWDKVEPMSAEAKEAEQKAVESKAAARKEADAGAQARESGEALPTGKNQSDRRDRDHVPQMSERTDRKVMTPRGAKSEERSLEEPLPQSAEAAPPATSEPGSGNKGNEAIRQRALRGLLTRSKEAPYQDPNLTATAGVSEPPRAAPAPGAPSERIASTPGATPAQATATVAAPSGTAAPSAPASSVPVGTWDKPYVKTEGGFAPSPSRGTAEGFFNRLKEEDNENSTDAASQARFMSTLRCNYGGFFVAGDSDKCRPVTDLNAKNIWPRYEKKKISTMIRGKTQVVNLATIKCEGKKKASRGPNTMVICRPDRWGIINGALICVPRGADATNGCNNRIKTASQEQQDEAKAWALAITNANPQSSRDAARMEHLACNGIANKWANQQAQSSVLRVQTDKQRLDIIKTCRALGEQTARLQLAAAPRLLTDDTDPSHKGSDLQRGYTDTAHRTTPLIRSATPSTAGEAAAAISGR